MPIPTFDDFADPNTALDFLSGSLSANLSCTTTPLPFCLPTMPNSTSHLLACYLTASTSAIFLHDEPIRVRNRACLFHRGLRRILPCELEYSDKDGRCSPPPSLEDPSPEIRPVSDVALCAVSSLLRYNTERFPGLRSKRISPEECSVDGLAQLMRFVFDRDLTWLQRPPLPGCLFPDLPSYELDYATLHLLLHLHEGRLLVANSGFERCRPCLFERDGMVPQPASLRREHESEPMSAPPYPTPFTSSPLATPPTEENLDAINGNISAFWNHFAGGAPGFRRCLQDTVVNICRQVADNPTTNYLGHGTPKRLDSFLDQDLPGRDRSSILLPFSCYGAKDLPWYTPHWKLIQRPSDFMPLWSVDAQGCPPLPVGVDSGLLRSPLHDEWS